MTREKAKEMVLWSVKMRKVSHNYNQKHNITVMFSTTKKKKSF